MINRIRLFFRKFTPVEERVLSEIRAVLPAAARQKYDRQISQINSVQRILDWTEINFYSIKRFRVVWESESLFSEKGEFKLAEVKFVLDAVEYNATIIAVSGRIFSLVIRPSIKKSCFRPVAEIQGCRLLRDPERICIDETTAPNHPVSYLEWFKRPSGHHVAGWTVNAPEDVHSVCLPSGDFLVLAIGEDGAFLLSRDTPADNEIYRVESADSDPVAVGNDFGEVLTSIAQ